MRRLVIAVLAVGPLVLTGCGGLGGAPATGSAAAAAAQGEPPSADAYTDDDLGTGWVMLGTDRKDTTRGQCEFSRFDGTDVTDLRADEVTAVVGVDNSDGSPEGGPDTFGLTTGRTGFTLRGSLDARGAVDSVVEIADERRADVREGVRIARVGFSGSAEDGTPFAAELVCLISS